MAKTAGTEVESSAPRRVGLDRDDVIAAALDLVRTEGPAGLSMRRLAEQLDVATPTIYWHVGSRDDLVAEVIRAHSRVLAALEVHGDQPRDRVYNAARNMWASAIEHRAFTSLAHQTGLSNLLAHPLEEVLLIELENAGLDGAAAARAAWSIIAVIGGLLLVALRDMSKVPADYQPAALWARSGASIQDATRAGMQAKPDLDDMCQFTLRAVIDACLQDTSSDPDEGHTT